MKITDMAVTASGATSAPPDQAGEGGPAGGGAARPAPGPGLPWRWLGLGALILASLFVIFVLPEVVNRYDLPLQPRTEVALPTPEAPAGISPFAAAQQSEQRKNAQDILAELLALSAELEALAVADWAPQDFEAGLAEAVAGDEHYRVQEFAMAAAAYARGRDSLAALRARVPEVFRQRLAAAWAALEAGDGAAAIALFELAVTLDDTSAEARQGLARARVLDEVLAGLAAAAAAIADGELETARATLREARDKDPANDDVAAQLARVNQLLREAEFNRLMSAGYAALDAGDPEAAIAWFARAEGLGVNGKQARAAITVTQTNLEAARIDARREDIATAEGEERWQDAVTAYDEVLAIDPSLSFAVAGRTHAAQRAHLDKLLDEAIAAPLRLADPQVYQQTLDVYYTGRALAAPGPRLRGQLEALDGLLAESQVPVTVRFLSDGITAVTLLRHSELGQFEESELALKPGEYVAVGRRPGYRDARVEFAVGFGATTGEVRVACEEPVAAGRRGNAPARRSR